MKHFRLQTLLNLRERARKDAEDAYLLAQQEMRRQEKVLDELEADLNQNTQKRNDRRMQYALSRDAGSSLSAFHIQELHVRALKLKEELARLSVDKQKSVVAETKTLVHAKHGQMLHANREFKSIEKLKDKWVAERNKAIERKDDIATDEIAQSRYVLSRNNL